jgi:anaerobic selenocysteine-containing dehydrogenase
MEPPVAIDPSSTPAWRKTACTFCSLNCGLEVQTEGRRITRVRGDKAHPESKGYICEKAQRIDAYQNAEDRITSPMRRRADGSYEAVDWDTAIEEIATGFEAIRDTHGGDKILFYGGGGQGNHLGGAYGDATLKALGVKYRSNALAQEKTGEFWVGGRMAGAGIHGDFEHAEVAVFVGKNPWQSHGFPRTRKVLNAISRDPARCLVVIDPRLSETAAKADIHLALKPGTDAWCLAALAAILVQEDLVDHPWVAEHTVGYEVVEPILRDIDVAAFAEACGVPEASLRQTSRRIAAAGSVSVFEDLGMQMSRHSTLGSYLQRLTWMLTGNFAKKGAHNAFVPFVSLSAASKGDVAGKKAPPRKRRTSPVTGSRIVIGLIPCNVMAEEILADHPNRFRGMFIESGNPVHSMADSPKMRAAMAALEFSVVIDVAMTETARCAHYVLPAASQFEKAEATFFNLEFPDNTFHLRHALFEPLEGTLPEAEIHARLVERLVGIDERHLRPLRLAARAGRPALGAALGALSAARPAWFDSVPVLLWRVLAPTLPEGTREGAVLWALAHLFVQQNKGSAAAAGFTGPLAGERLFDAIVSAGTGVVYASADDFSESWTRVRTAGGRFNLVIPELIAPLVNLAHKGWAADSDFPFVLSAGERRSGTTNTILRAPEARPKGRDAALRMCPTDAEELGVGDGDRVCVTTRGGTCEVEVEVTPNMRAGHVSLPNGFGIGFGGPKAQGLRTIGVSTNELTRSQDRDPFVGTPWHKYVPARVERVGA